MFTTPKNTIKVYAIVFLIILAGCQQQKPTYTLKPLQPQTTYDQLTKKTEAGDVTVRCATCSRKDVHDIFGKPGNLLYSKQKGNHITPVHIYIENNSGYAWSLSPYDIRLPLADIQDVKDRFTRGATKQGLTSFTLTSGCGIALAGFGAAASIFNPILGAPIMGAGCALIFAAPIRSHHKAAHISSQNMHFAHVLDSISLENHLVVHPREHVSRLIFVEHKRALNNFVLRLCNNDNLDHTISYNLYFEQKTQK